MRSREPIRWRRDRMMATSIASTCPLVPPDIRLVSRVWVPAHMMPDSADRRACVCVWRLLIDASSVSTGDPALDDGWHPPETDGAGPFRWTSGSTRLPSGAAAVTLDLIGDERSYWLKPRTRAEATTSPGINGWVPAT